MRFEGGQRVRGTDNINDVVKGQIYTVKGYCLCGCGELYVYEDIGLNDEDLFEPYKVSNEDRMKQRRAELCTDSK